MTNHCFRVNGVEHWVNFTRAGTLWGCTKKVLSAPVPLSSQKNSMETGEHKSTSMIFTWQASTAQCWGPWLGCALAL